MIINIDGDDLESLEQLKGYFNPDPDPESQVYFDLLDYGQHGDLSGWLREHGEEGMASRVDAIPEGLRDSEYYAALKMAVTGETVVDTSSLKPSFERCFHFEGADCDIEGNEAKVKVKLKVLMSVNEDYRLEVRSGWKPCEKKVNSYNYSEGDSVVVEFVISKIQDQELGDIVVMADGKVLDIKKITSDGEVLDHSNYEKPKEIKIGLRGLSSGLIRSDVSIKRVTTDGKAMYNKKATTDGESMDFEVEGVSFKMIYVEGGTFTMGSGYSVEKPTHQVTLNSYYIGETQVTQALWKAVMGGNPANFKSDQKPVEMVSWNDCQEFIERLNAIKGKKFHLPTEAEWEFAAIGGNKRLGYKFSGSYEQENVAWYAGNSERKTHPVKMKHPNELDIYDMLGNVREWCQDRYGTYRSDAQVNPRGPYQGSKRVCRGGSYADYSVSDTYREGYKTGARYKGLGFRLALDLSSWPSYKE